MVSRSCFGCGLLGGFFSIQQRLKTFGQVDLERLSSSLLEIVLIPVYGGVCALAHCVGFLSQIFTGALFPQLAVAPVHFPTPADLQSFFRQSYPASDGDLAKLMFWLLVAGSPSALSRRLSAATRWRGTRTAERTAATLGRAGLAPGRRFVGG